MGVPANSKRVIDALNEALATALTSVSHSKRRYFRAHDLNAAPIAAEFLGHAIDDQTHADKIASRIAQLGGMPDLHPTATRVDPDCSTAGEPTAIIEEHLIAQRIALASYQRIIRRLGNDDPATCRVVEQIADRKHEHAGEMRTILTHMGAS